MSKRYAKSESLLERALKSIPLGSQTFSKSYTQWPRGASPFFIDRAKGARVWDVDGNEYVDLVSSLASITLGYNDPDVNAAVAKQLEQGTIYSLPHPLEMEVAEAVCRMVPCADLVRFGKNGSDATSGAIRVARAYTERDHVAVCGYHGWQDWYIGSTARHRGVPQAVRDLTHAFAYNDLGSLEKLFAAHPKQFAAVILEPMNVVDPAPGFLQGVVDLAHKHGALAVFDETITGFRYAKGGAQEHFNVTPDLATFGKGLANGFPVSAIVGKREYMKLMEEIFFSFTFGGETLSLAAAKATLEKLDREPVIETIARQGGKLLDGARAAVERADATGLIAVSGHPTWSFLNFKDANGYPALTVKTLFMQEMLKRGVMTYGTHNVNYSHDDSCVAQVLGAYGEVLPMLVAAVRDKSLESKLECAPLQPLFRIR